MFLRLSWGIFIVLKKGGKQTTKRCLWSHKQMNKNNIKSNKNDRCTALMQPHTYLCVLEVMSPKRSDLVLATHIPNSKTDVFIFYSFHIETFTGKRETGLKLIALICWRQEYNNLLKTILIHTYYFHIIFTEFVLGALMQNKNGSATKQIFEQAEQEMMSFYCDTALENRKTTLMQYQTFWNIHHYWQWLFNVLVVNVQL